ncbi:MAG: SDR family NAD(P)-dependent oxidoreductase [Pseudomonadota bacterium]
MTQPLCIVAGVGPGTGMACCHRFRQAGYRVAILARDLQRLQEYASGDADILSYACDLSDPDAIAKVFEDILDSHGTPQTVIYNAGSGLFGGPMEVSQDDFEMAWRINSLGLLCVAQAVIPNMIEQGGGNLVITGATASLRGGANFTAFSSAKAAQRSLAQSLARSHASQGVHVALVIVDGIIDIPRTRERLPDKPDDFFLKAEAIADTYYALTQQDPSAWTFEVDLRPHTESW